MKAAVFHDREDVRIEDLPTPSPRPGEVLVRNMVCGICGSDKSLWQDPGPKPGLQGHEAAGVVAEVGRGVTGLHVGDHVAVTVVTGCGVCLECQRGRFNYCREAPQVSMGGYAEYQAVLERMALPLPDGMPFEVGCLLTDAVGTPARAIRRSGLQPGDSAAVFGCGPIGLFAVYVLRAFGARVIALDAVPYRLEAARALGADFVVDVSAEAPADAVRQITGSGADYSFECSGQAQKEAMAAVRAGGRVAIIGEAPRVELSPSEDLIRRSIEVFGSWYLTREDYWLNLELVERGLIDPARLITHVIPFGEIARAFDIVCNKREQVVKAVLKF